MVGRQECTYSELRIILATLLHRFLGTNGIVTAEHLDERMAFLLVDNASLNRAVLAENLAQFALRVPTRLVRTDILHSAKGDWQP